MTPSRSINWITCRPAFVQTRFLLHGGQAPGDGLARPHFFCSRGSHCCGGSAPKPRQRRLSNDTSHSDDIIIRYGGQGGVESGRNRPYPPERHVTEFGGAPAFVVLSG